MSRPKAKSSGVRLTEADAAIAKGMLKRGDRQHDIAAWFGVNSGRIAEIANGAAFSWVQINSENLPPVGPYPNARQTLEAKAALASARAALEMAEGKLALYRR